MTKADDLTCDFCRQVIKKKEIYCIVEGRRFALLACKLCKEDIDNGLTVSVNDDY